MRKRLFLLSAVFMLCAVFFCVSAAASGSKVFILDNIGAIAEANEKQIYEKAVQVAEKTGFNIVIVAEDDIGYPKTDAHVVEYADDKYEELCGINTDGILFLINCDTKYDYISTSGVCINYFSDYRIDMIFDDIWDDLKDENYAQAAYTFVYRVEQFYDQGKANHQTEILGAEVDVGLFNPGIAIVGGIFFGIIIYAVNSRQFRIEKPGTRNYILENSLAFDVNTDTFVGNNVKRIYTPRSSSSSHGGRRSSVSHRSSTHHSHSGGRHGGGGRHR